MHACMHVCMYASIRTYTIAHRLNTIRDADAIAVVEGGKVCMYACMHACIYVCNMMTKASLVCMYACMFAVVEGGKVCMYVCMYVCIQNC